MGCLQWSTSRPMHAWLDSDEGAQGPIGVYSGPTLADSCPAGSPRPRAPKACEGGGTGGTRVHERGATIGCWVRMHYCPSTSHWPAAVLFQVQICPPPLIWLQIASKKSLEVSIALRPDRWLDLKCPLSGRPCAPTKKGPPAPARALEIRRPISSFYMTRSSQLGLSSLPLLQIWPVISLRIEFFPARGTQKTMTD